MYAMCWICTSKSSTALCHACRIQQPEVGLVSGIPYISHRVMIIIAAGVLPRLWKCRKQLATK